MFKTLIWDYRDRNSDHPQSTIGTFENKVDAWKAVARYLTSVPNMLEWIERVEVRLVE